MFTRNIRNTYNSFIKDEIEKEIEINILFTLCWQEKLAVHQHICNQNKYVLKIYRLKIFYIQSSMNRGKLQTSRKAGACTKAPWDIYKQGLDNHRTPMLLSCPDTSHYTAHNKPLFCLEVCASNRNVTLFAYAHLTKYLSVKLFWQKLKSHLREESVTVTSKHICLKNNFRSEAKAENLTWRCKQPVLLVFKRATLLPALAGLTLYWSE